MDVLRFQFSWKQYAGIIGLVGLFFVLFVAVMVLTYDSSKTPFVSANPGTCYINSATTVNQGFVDTYLCDLINIGGTNATITWSGTVDLVGGGSVHVTGTNVYFDQPVQLGNDDDFYVDSGATLGHGYASGTGLQINANNITITGNINTDGRGCRGTTADAGYGPSTSTGVCAQSTSGFGRGRWGGAAHGGIGGKTNYGDNNPQLTTYDSQVAPTLLGSSGGAWSSSDAVGGSGGGRVSLQATSTLTVNGNITANATNGTSGSGNNGSGGGSGGSVYLKTATITGSGSIKANGGNGAISYGGGGGGGRISILFDTNSNFYFSATSVQALKGLKGPTTGFDGSNGTTWILDRQSDDGAGNLTITSGLELLDGGDYERSSINIAPDAYLFLATSTATTTLQTTSTLTRVIFDNSKSVNGFVLSVPGDINMVSSTFNFTGANNLVVVSSTGAFYASSTSLTFSNATTVRINVSSITFNTSTFAVTRSGSQGFINPLGDVTFNYSTYTGAVAGDVNANGGMLNLVVTSTLSLKYYSTIASSVSSTMLGTLFIDASSTIDASTKGCAGTNANSGWGPATTTGICAQGATGYGHSLWGGGGYGGYGGAGGTGGSQNNRSEVYGDPFAPVYVGSSGGAWSSSDAVGGTGGGAIHLEAGKGQIDGWIKSNGGAGTSGSGSNGSGGGSGGSIYLKFATLQGTGVSTGVGKIVAHGGNGAMYYGGGGGGGRIAINYTWADFNFDNVTSTYGSGYATYGLRGNPGTVWILDRLVDDGEGNVRINSGFDFPVGGDYYRPSFSFGPGTILSCQAQDTLTVSSTNFDLSTANWDCASAINRVNLIADNTLTFATSTISFSNASSVFLTANTWNVATSTMSVTKSGSTTTWDIVNDITLKNFVFTGASAGTVSRDSGFLYFAHPISLTLSSSTIASNVSSTLLTNLTLDTKSSIDASLKGCPSVTGANGYGPDANGICKQGVGGYGKISSGYVGGGGAHGGRGGGNAYSIQTTLYDNAFVPSMFGASGGGENGYYTQPSGVGGGVVQLQISGTLTNNGSIKANGGVGFSYGSYSAGSGAGGSIYIKTDTLAGSGSMQANGGNGVAPYYGGTYDGGGAGGGGRVAVYFANNGGFDPTKIYATHGTYQGPGLLTPYNGSTWVLDRLVDDGVGTLWINSGLDFPTDGDYKRPTINVGWNTDFTCNTSTSLLFYSDSSLVFNGLMWDCISTLTDFYVSSTNNVYFNSSTLIFNGYQPAHSANFGSGTGLYTSNTVLTFSNTTSFNIITPTWTNVTTSISTARVAGDSRAAFILGSDTTFRDFTYTGSWAGNTSNDEGVLSIPNTISLTMVSSTINSSVSSTQLVNLLIDSKSSINATGKGCTGPGGTNGRGPNASGICMPGVGGYGKYSGGSYIGGGGAHGGRGGGGSYSIQNTIYDDAFNPTMFGASGGGEGGYGNLATGMGGGVVRLQCSDTLTVNGSIKADGTAGVGYGSYNGGSGAGGTVNIKTTTLSGSGSIQANGGNGSPPYYGGTYDGGGAGGGGRVAVYFANNGGFDPTKIYATHGTYQGPNNLTPYNGSSWVLDRLVDDGVGTLWINSGLDFPNGGDYIRPTINLGWNLDFNCNTSTSLLFYADNSLVFNGLTWVCTSTLTDFYVSSTNYVYFNSSTLLFHYYQPANSINLDGGKGLYVSNTIANFTSALNSATIGSGNPLSTVSSTFNFSNTTSVNVNATTWTVVTTTLNVPKTSSNANINTSNDLTLTDFTYTGGAVSTLNTNEGFLNFLGTGGLTMVSSTITANVSSTQLASFSMDSKSTISALGRGCPGGGAWVQDGFGPSSSTGICVRSGGGANNTNGQTYGGLGSAHGGYGGTQGYTTPQWNSYDSAVNPTLYGSGGGCVGGAGGGVIKIQTNGAMSLNGTISAAGGDGAAGSSAGGGSGGSILLKSDTLTGSGSLYANGGNGTSNSYGGGGGGRIAIFSDSLAGFSPTNLRASGGLGTGKGTTGTVWMLDRKTDDGAGNAKIYQGFDFTPDGDYTRDSITIESGINLGCTSTNSLVLTSVVPLTLTSINWFCTTNTLGYVALGSSAAFTLTSSTINFAYASSLTINATSFTANTSTLTNNRSNSYNNWNVSSATLNNFTFNGNGYGTQSATSGRLNITEGITLSLVKSTLNVASISSTFSTVYVDASSTIDASSLGCPGYLIGGANGSGPDANGLCTQSTAGYGYGNNNTGGGAAHGGAGGRSSAIDNPQTTTYGSQSFPKLPGSSGGTGGYSQWSGGTGGGFLSFVVTNRFTALGQIKANGSIGNNCSGGGSGGSIYIKANEVACTLGTGTNNFTAKGGAGGPWYNVGAGGGGGGGRISINYIDLINCTTSTVDGSATTTPGAPGGGAATAGGVGTLYWNFDNHSPNAPFNLRPVTLVDGSPTSTNVPRFYFDLSDPETTQQVKYGIQVATTSDFGIPIIDYTSALQAQGSANFLVGQAAGSGSYTTGTAGQTLADGDYYWRVMTYDSVNATSSWTTANGGEVAFNVSSTYPGPVGGLTGVRLKLTDSRATQATNMLVEFTTETSLATTTQVCTKDPCGSIDILFPRFASGAPVFDIPAGFTTSSRLANPTGDIWIAGLPTGMTLADVAVTSTNRYAPTSTHDMVRIHFNMNGKTMPRNTRLLVYFFNEQIGNPNKVKAAGYEDVYNFSFATAVSTTAANYGYENVDSFYAMAAIGEGTGFSAKVNQSLTFSVDGVKAGVSIGTEITDIESTASACPFGTLKPNVAKNCAQQLGVSTNAYNGFVVYVMQDGNMRSGIKDIDQFKDGVPVNCGGATSTDCMSAVTWTPPAANVNNEASYGHLGYSGTDTNIYPDGTATHYAAIPNKDDFDTLGAPVMMDWYDTGGSIVYEYINLKVEISAMQEAGSYHSQIWYAAVPNY